MIRVLDLPVILGVAGALLTAVGLVVGKPEVQLAGPCFNRWLTAIPPRALIDLAVSAPMDRRLANRNIRTALIAGLIALAMFAASFAVAFVY